MRLLIIDDEKQICEEFRETLEQEGYQVDTASDGKKGLDMVRSKKYDVVFLDAAMPSWDGQEVLKRIRRFSAVPVALISGFLTNTREQEIMELGAFACLRKPLELNEVKALLRGVEHFHASAR
ncbi:MAG: response regulator [Candidatus Omnitrophica bacterium]|nr:response regulator [Candidatus Omnitrophota bacterium]